jgi:hypothetical protein
VKVKDKKLKEMVDVCDKDCLSKRCYWPRPDPGSFTPGVGYSTRNGRDGAKTEWLCGTREIRGCPVSDAVKAAIDAHADGAALTMLGLSGPGE